LDLEKIDTKEGIIVAVLSLGTRIP
jgi:hypothetical protein